MSCSSRGYNAQRLASQTVRSAARFARRLTRFGVACTLFACAVGPRPCRTPSACPTGSECLADRCVPLGAEPVDPRSKRIVLAPVAIAVVRRDARVEGALPPTVTFGGAPGQSEALLVRFAPLPSGLDVDSAFLLLEPARDAEPTGDDLDLSVAMTSGDWASGVLGEAPSSHGPASSGIGRTRPPAVLRIDVTAQARELAQRPQSERGFLLRATRPSTRGGTYSTGLDGVAPRLDVYFRQRVTR